MRTRWGRTEGIHERTVRVALNRSTLSLLPSGSGDSDADPDLLRIRAALACQDEENRERWFDAVLPAADAVRLGRAILAATDGMWGRDLTRSRARRDAERLVFLGQYGASLAEVTECCGWALAWTSGGRKCSQCDTPARVVLLGPAAAA